MIQFDLPKERSSIIKVIGVGGGGSNAVNHMYSQQIDGVDFIICNTDAQAIIQSRVPNKIQLGPLLTQGLGAGANPNVGRQATEESIEEIKSILEVNTKMAFITAGMGGGTGTGGAPILAKICKDLGILTVGIVTTPFSYEGKRRQQQAEEGIELLKDYVDTLLVISNDKLRHQFGNLKMKDAFSRADNVLATAAKCITDVINSTGQINVDFADVCTVMRNGGVAILGSAIAAGSGRAQQAIEEALNSPLLNDNEIRGAKWILININSAEGEHEFTMDEVEIIQQHLIGQAGESTDVILGLGYDNTLGDKIGITLIATGFEYKDPFPRAAVPVVAKTEEKIVLPLEMPVTEMKPKEKPLVMEEKKPEVFSANTLSPELTPKLREVAEPAPAKGPMVMMPNRQNQPAMQQKPAAPPTPAAPAAETFEWVLNTNTEPVRPSMPAATQPKVPSPSPATPSNPAKGGGSYLTRPMNIYADEESVRPSAPVPERKIPAGELNSEMKMSMPEAKTPPPARDEPGSDMQLVFHEEAGMPEMNETPPAYISEIPPIDEPGYSDDTESLKRRAADRINKLRNLSFNINGADANNEFETVPAYIRRNLELYNSVNHVENFYSQYEVRGDGNKSGDISTINTFLDGKKPD